MIWQIFKKNSFVSLLIAMTKIEFFLNFFFGVFGNYFALEMFIQVRNKSNFRYDVPSLSFLNFNCFFVNYEQIYLIQLFKSAFVLELKELIGFETFEIKLQRPNDL